MKATGDFEWSVVRLTDGRVVEMHYTFQSKQTKLAFCKAGYCEPDREGLKQFGVDSKPVVYTPGPNNTLTENPQGAEAAAWYTYQAYRAHLAGYPQDVLYALFMAEYHNDVRTWHKGPPPHVGWWNASHDRCNTQWRWWNGCAWSDAWYPETIRSYVRPTQLSTTARWNGYTWSDAWLYATASWQDQIMWTTYWPENARVTRQGTEP